MARKKKKKKARGERRSPKKQGKQGSSKSRWKGGSPDAAWAGAAELRVLSRVDGFVLKEWAGAIKVSPATMRQWIKNSERVPGPTAWYRLAAELEVLRREAGGLTPKGLREVIDEIPAARRSRLTDEEWGELLGQVGIKASDDDVLAEAQASAEDAEARADAVKFWPKFSAHCLEFAPDLEDHWHDGEFHLAPAILWSVIRRSGTQRYKAEAISRRNSQP